MSYKNIEKISSVLFKINKNFTLKHVVKLANRNQNGKRELFHSEYTYLSAASYTDVKYLKSIKLQFSSYLLLEETDKDKEWNMRENVIINQMGIPHLKKALKKARKWLKKDDMYFYDGDRLCLNKELKKQKAIMVGGKRIVLTPAIIIYDDKEYEGINMYINSTNLLIQLTYDKLEALYYIIKKFDLYEAGLTMISYVGRPEFGMYNSDLDTEHRGSNEYDFDRKNVSSKGMDKFMQNTYNSNNIQRSYMNVDKFFD